MAASGVTRGEVARGAGLAGLARLGAVIEALAQPLYTWLFGLSGYGLYVVAWGVVNLAENLLDLAMTAALQRAVPTAGSEEAAHAAVKVALIATLVPTTAVTALAAWQADAVGAALNLPADAVRLFAWALPLWTLVEVATSAARARRAFGPEIRLRIFWEQAARILFALGFFAAGATGSLGLMAAHLASLTLTAMLSLRLLGCYYDLRLLASAPVRVGEARALIATGLALLPANLSRRLLIDAPPVVLNLMLPGARGAAAAGLFEIARKLATVPLIVRQAFQYVMAPLSSAQAHADRAAIGPLYRFAARVSTALVVPLAGLLVFAGADLLSVYRPEARAALPLLVLLAAARAAEAVTGAASTVVEMIGHRLLPLVNSLVGVALWAGLAWWLVPQSGALGMAVAVAAATILSAWIAVAELAIGDRLRLFGRRLARALGIALIGVAGMAAVEAVAGGPLRFVGVLLLWAATSWAALRWGLSAEDRAAFGTLGRRLRLG